MVVDYLNGPRLISCPRDLGDICVYVFVNKMVTLTSVKQRQL